MNLKIALVLRLNHTIKASVINCRVKRKNVSHYSIIGLKKSIMLIFIPIKHFLALLFLETFKGLNDNG